MHGPPFLDAYARNILKLCTEQPVFHVHARSIKVCTDHHSWTHMLGAFLNYARSNQSFTYMLGALKYARSNHSWTYMLGAFLNYARSNQSFTYMLGALKYARSNQFWAYMVVCVFLTGARVSFRLTSVNFPGKLTDAGMSRVCAIIKLIHVKSKRPTLAYKSSLSASIRKRCNWRILRNMFYTIYTMIVSFLYM